LRPFLKSRLRAHVERYSAEVELVAELDAEWTRLAAFLEEYGGLEQAVRRTYLAAADRPEQRSGIFADTLISLRKRLPETDDRTSLS